MHMTEQQNERRRDIRVTFRTTVRISFPDGLTFDECETTDVSVSGVFVKGVNGVGFGDKCRVELHLTGKTSNLVLKLAGEVVRFQEDGVALHFLEVDEDSFYHLKNIVYFSYKHAGDAGGILGDVDDVDDESLYYDLDASGKVAPMPDNYLDETNGKDSDDFDDDLDEDIAKHIRPRHDDDDY
jgi:hypothetical protein